MYAKRLWVLLLVLTSCLHGLHSAELPYVEVLVTSKIAPKEVQDNYLATLQRSVVTAFSSLNPRLAVAGSDGKVADGTAQYRVVVEHVGTASVGAQIGGERLNLQSVVGGGGWTHIYFVEVQQTGTLSVKILQWIPDESKYKELIKWTAPMPVSDRELANKGRIEVGKATGGFSQPDDNKAPISLAEAQKVAALSIQPGNIRDLLLGKLVAVTATKATVKPIEPNKGGGVEVEGELSVKNLSPWTLKRIQVLVNSSGGIFFPGTGPVQMHGAAPWVEFPQPLAAGAEVKVPVIGKDRKNQKPGIQGIEFLATQP